MKKRGGQLYLNSHVDQVLFEDGAAVGVQLRSGATIRANRAVVSNASVWDTLKLLPAEAVPEQYKQSSQEIPTCPSFMHLHIGLDATGKALHHIHALVD